MDVVLIVAAGFLIGGAWSCRQQGSAARAEGAGRKGRQLYGLGVILILLAALAAAGGILRLV
ncbi:MAG: hypothetical protein ACR2F6_13400 [Mycobacteriales bacterium]